jgi:dTDP-4-dehydrorhamnose reductase
MRQEWDIVLGIHHNSVSLKGVSSCHLNLDCPDELKKIILQVSPDLIVHAAGLTNVDQCELNPSLAYQGNVEIAKNIALVAGKLNVSLIHISTDHLFSGECSFYEEAADVQPLNEYAKTKYLAEKAVQELCSDALILRTNFYGWGHRYRNSFTDLIVNQLRNGDRAYVFNDVFYTPILISHLVDVAHQLVSRSAKGVYNVVGSERLTKYDFAVNLAHIFNLPQDLLIPSSIAEATHLVKRPKDMSLSNIKLKNELGCNLPDTISSLSELLSQEKNGLSNEIFNSICR